MVVYITLTPSTGVTDLVCHITRSLNAKYTSATHVKTTSPRLKVVIGHGQEPREELVNHPRSASLLENHCINECPMWKKSIKKIKVSIPFFAGSWLLILERYFFCGYMAGHDLPSLGGWVVGIVSKHDVLSNLYS